jgi:hypothetical protein
MTRIFGKLSLPHHFHIMCEELDLIFKLELLGPGEK